jgi:ATP-dependent DNA ligase
MTWTKRKGIQLAYPLEEKRLLKWDPPYLCQPKLDGERCRAIPIMGRDNYLLVSSEENPFYSIPHIQEEMDWLRARLPNSLTEFDGELYFHSWGFEKIHSVVSRTVNLHPDHEEMEYHIFDICNMTLQQYRRLLMLKEMSSCFPPHIKLIKTDIANSFDEVMMYYNLYRKLGFEGIIVRHWMIPYYRRRSTFMMKFKPKRTDRYQAVDVKEEISIEGVPKGRAGAVVLIDPEGNIFSAGGMTDVMKQEYWERRDEIPGLMVEISYQNLTEKGVPRFGTNAKVLWDK